MQRRRCLDGSYTLLIWLGKVVLHQKEKTGITLEATDTLADLSAPPARRRSRDIPLWRITPKTTGSDHPRRGFLCGDSADYRLGSQLQELNENGVVNG